MRVLLVDDFEPIRRSVCSILQQRPNFQVIGQAGNGMEAVEKAEELQPDVILLDISLPKLNGIDAARRILKLSPKSKIIFLSQNGSPWMVEGALSMGANGYLLKMDAGEELFEAIEAVIQGGQFVSRTLRREVKVRHGGASA